MNAQHPVDRAVRGLAPRIDGLTEDPGADGVLALLDDDPAAASGAAPPPPRPCLRRWFVGVPVAAAAAAAAVVGTALLTPADVFGPRPAEALEVTEEDGFIVGEVVDPLADPDKYGTAFAEHGLDVRMVLKPRPEKWAGTLISVDYSYKSGEKEPDVQVVDPPGQCRAAVRGCPVTVKVPKGYDGTVDLVIGRGATAAETWDGVSAPTDPGKLAVVDEGAIDDLTGVTVGEFRDRIGRAGLAIDTYWLGRSFRDDPEHGPAVEPTTDGAEPADDPGLGRIPDDWFITDVASGVSDGRVSIVVDEERP